MRTIRSDNSGLSDALFSKTQRKILSLLFGKPDKSFYVKEIVRYAEVGIGSVQRELEKFSRAGLLTTENIGNQKHYQANRNSPIFDELRGIVQKTFGLAGFLRKELEEFSEDIELAFVYGSLAKGTDKAKSDVDLMIISDKLAYSEVFTSIVSVEANIGRPINPTIYTAKEFKNKIQADNSFVTRVIAQPKIFLIGSEDDIPTI
jgi:predicted nucleotidyltransferase